MGDQTAKQLRIAPLFGPTLFPSNVINKTRQEYIQDNKMSLVVSSAAKVATNTIRPKTKVEIKSSTEAKGQVAAAERQSQPIRSVKKLLKGLSLRSSHRGVAVKDKLASCHLTMAAHFTWPMTDIHTYQ